jgi:hypothetical protein
MVLSNVVRIDVREALMRPDLSTIADRKTWWYANVPHALADGAVVPVRGEWTLAAAKTLAPSGAADPLTRGVLAMYAREREGTRRAYPQDPNFTGPLEVTWRRLPREEADPRPFEKTHCLALAADGTLAPGPSTFAVESADVPDLPAAPAPAPAPAATHAPPSSPLLSTLHAYGEKQATNDEVIRAMIEHPSWLAPVGMFADGEHNYVPKLVLYGDPTRMPKGALWIFSDRERADRANAALVAKGGQLGPYAEGVDGVSLFRRLSKVAFAEMNVNIGSPAADTFFFGESDGIGGLLALWATAIGIEQRLAAGKLDDPALARDVHDFPGLSVFQSAEQGLLRSTQEGKTHIIVCTSIDCADALAGAMSEPLRADFKRITASGAEIMKVVARLGVDGIVFNLAGPGKRSYAPAGFVAAVVALG